MIDKELKTWKLVYRIWLTKVRLKPFLFKTVRLNLSLTEKHFDLSVWKIFQVQVFNPNSFDSSSYSY